MISTIQVEKYLPNNYIFSVIICKVSYWQKLYLIFLLKVDKNLEIHFYYTIFIFGLLINLRVKGNRKLILDFEEVPEQRSEF